MEIPYTSPEFGKHWEGLLSPQTRRINTHAAVAVPRVLALDIPVQWACPYPITNPVTKTSPLDVFHANLLLKIGD